MAADANPPSERPRRRSRARPAGDGAKSPFPRLPRFGDLLDATDDMIEFVEKYQKVWESEGRAMTALGEFLTARSESLQAQVDLMRMGSDTARRYTQWSDALLGLRPDTLIQQWMATIERFRARPEAAAPESEPAKEE